MSNLEKVIGILRKELPYLKNNYQVRRLGIFGSFVKQKQSVNSDIDIIIEFKKPIGLDFIELAEYIEKLLGRKVDILTTEGIRSIRIRNVAKDIKRSVLYV